MNADLHVYLLGEFRASYKGEPLTGLRPTRLQWLLAYLLLNRHAPQPRHHLAFLFWPNSNEAQALSNLRNLLLRLRRALPDPDSFLREERHTVQWREDAPYRLDTAEFERAIAASRSALTGGEPTGAVGSLREAIATYRGDLLPACYEDWIVPAREALYGEHLEALERLANLLEEQGAYSEAISVARRYLRHEPLREAMHRRLMQLHALDGDRAAALAAYNTCVRVLQDELGVEPDVATREAWERLSNPVQARPRATQNNLPPRLTSFIGREAAIEEAKLLVSSTRLLTLVGPGGAGKTRLALEIGDRLADEVARGVWFVDLTTLNDPVLIPHAIAASIGLRPPAMTPGEAELISMLAAQLLDKRMLLILDNCEHLLSGCAMVIAALLGTCPLLAIIATSRERLGIAGETVLRVAPLSLPRAPIGPGDHPVTLSEVATSEAARLFADRAALAVPGFTLNEQNAQAIARICRRLDGIPLAIELAAARPGSLAPEEIAARLDDRFRLLAAGNQLAGARHQTLLASIDWSYDLLLPAERRLLRRLAVFAGRWTLGAAAAIAEAEFDVVLRLVEKSLVVAEEQAGGQTRYRLLETIRYYARDRLAAAGEEVLYRRRHAAWFLMLARQTEAELRGPGQEAAIARLAAEHDNFRAALSWSSESGEHEMAAGLAAALADFWDVCGYWAEGQYWLRNMLERLAGLPTALRFRLLLAGATFATYQDDYRQASALGTQALLLARESGDKPARAGALALMGDLAWFQDDYRQARALYEESLYLARQAGDPHRAARAMESLATVHRRLGEHARANALLDEALALYRGGGSKRDVGRALLNLAWVAFNQEDPAQAIALAAEAEQIFRGLEDRDNIADAGLVRGYAALAREEPAQAEELGRTALGIFRDIGNNYGRCYSLILLGYTALGRADTRQAGAELREALRLAEQLKSQYATALSLIGLAGLALMSEDGPPAAHRAALLAGAAWAIAEKINTPLNPTARKLRDETLSRAGTLLSAQDLAAALDEGRAMPPGTLMRRALYGP